MVTDAPTKNRSRHVIKLRKQTPLRQARLSGVFSHSAERVDWLWPHFRRAALPIKRCVLNLVNIRAKHFPPSTLLVAFMAFSQQASAGSQYFTTIAEGEIVNRLGLPTACAWADFDSDGLDDLFVSTKSFESRLMRSRGDGTFTRIFPGDFFTRVFLPGNSTGCAWGDVDNDGGIDLLQTAEGVGGGVFLHPRNKASVQLSSDVAYHPVWGDFDNDGRLDFAVFLAFFKPSMVVFRNGGDGTFKPNAVIEEMSGNLIASPTCGDFDNDGDLDLFVAAWTSGGRPQKNLLFRNRGDGTFAQVFGGQIAQEFGASRAAAWGDYDNDGNLDMFVANLNGQNNLLYHNRGDGTFAKITDGSIVNDSANAAGCAWGDFDNDGFLDLFVANRSEQNFLYRNQGDGTFTKLAETSLTNSVSRPAACAWGDYDDDGFLDLFVPGGSLNNGGGQNILLHNNRNRNHWVKVRCGRNSRYRVGDGISGNGCIWEGVSCWKWR